MRQRLHCNARYPEKLQTCSTRANPRPHRFKRTKWTWTFISFAGCKRRRFSLARIPLTAARFKAKVYEVCIPGVKPHKPVHAKLHPTQPPTSSPPHAHTNTSAELSQQHPTPSSSMFLVSSASNKTIVAIRLCSPAFRGRMMYQSWEEKGDGGKLMPVAAGDKHLTSKKRKRIYVPMGKM